MRIRSADGTPIAVWVEGRGPALVMVHGSIADHTTFDPFIEVFEDVAAVVDAVATGTGRKVALFGHSYGANCAMGGAARTRDVHHPRRRTRRRRHRSTPDR